MSHRPLFLGASVAALMALGSTASADFVILDDLIVDGSACIGFDCVNGESFGFDTLRLKENNLRIKFEDTSSTASFPTTDWTLVANDSANGGQNKFSILDSSTNRTIVTFEGNAPSNSLYVDDGGRVGFGTSIPVADLHVKTGNTPTLRLEQDGTSGFSAQTFDVAANEANFFVRDATNGSTLPFRIRPGADSNALFIDSDNNIGIGTPSPTDDIHIIRSSGSVGIRMQTGDSPEIFRMALNATLDKFVLNFDDAVGPDFTLDIDGNVEIRGGLITTGGGGACTVADPCDAVFDPELYTVRPMEDYAAYMWANKHLPSVGPTGPDAPINMTEKMLRMLNALEHAHIYIDQLNERITVLEAMLETQN